MRSYAQDYVDTRGAARPAPMPDDAYRQFGGVPVVRCICGANVGGSPFQDIIMATVGMEPGSSAVDPWECVDHFLGVFRDAPYFRPGTQWKDYEPAYRLGCETFARHRGRSVADLDGELELEWRDAKWNSRLSWSEARAAIDDAWTWLARRTNAQDTDSGWRGLYVQLIGLLAQRVQRRTTTATPQRIEMDARQHPRTTTRSRDGD